MYNDKLVYKIVIWVGFFNSLTNQRHIYWESAHILRSLQGVNVKVTSVHKLMWYKLFLFSKIAVFLRFREIYVHVFAIIKQPT